MRYTKLSERQNRRRLGREIAHEGTFTGLVAVDAAENCGLRKLSAGPPLADGRVMTALAINDRLASDDQDRFLAAMLDRRAQKLQLGDYVPANISAIRARLETMLRELGVQNAEVADFRRLAGGASKEQFCFRLSAPGRVSEQLVLRMDPTDGVLETSRQREFEILAVAGELVPVPEPRWLDPDGRWLGAPAMITSFVTGTTKPSSGGAGVSGLGTGFTPEWRRKLAPQFMEQLSAIHRVDIRDSRLSHYEVPDADPFQAARFRVNLWSRVWRESALAPNPVFTVVESWLRANLPAADELVLVHGDFRTGNYLFDEASGEITAILDWELAHIGDYHEDLAWSLVEIFGARDEEGQYLCSNLMREDEFIEHYERATGRSVNRRTLHFYRILLAWSVVAMASNGLSAANNHHNHQDILLTWLSMVTPPLLDELTRLLLEESGNDT